jgi:hypothetical protein
MVLAVNDKVNSKLDDLGTPRSWNASKLDARNLLRPEDAGAPAGGAVAAVPGHVGEWLEPVSRHGATRAD